MSPAVGPGWQESVVAAARRVLPPHVFHYVATGARESVSAAEASAAWEAVRFAPHVLRDVRATTLRTTLLGSQLTSPVGIAPSSLQRLAHPDGELAMARAAAARGSLVVVSINAGTLFEQIGDTGATWWLQVYLTEDRSLVEPLLRRAVAGGASGVVLTVDTPVPGTKYVDDEAFGDLGSVWRVNRGDDDAGAAFFEAPYARNLSSADVGWLAERSGLPVVVKGVVRADDARHCAEQGASGVWVSNHGGRQLDRAVATAAALPAVVSAVAGGAEVYVDGGIRSGLDALAALALGARGVFCGRLPFFGLAAGGEEGVRDVLATVDEELLEALALCGLTAPDQAPGIVHAWPGAPI